MGDILKGRPLYLVTDRRLCRGKGLNPLRGLNPFKGLNPLRGLVAAVEEAVSAGVRLVQLREKDLPARELLALARELRLVTSRHGAMLIVNNRLDAAILSDADGVHLGQGDFSPADARPFLAKGKLIGVSTHSLEEALKAEAGGADYITFGPVCHTPSKAAYGPPTGFGELKKAVDAVRIPVFAIGGMKTGTIKDALAAGAKGVAVITAILGGNDISGNVKELMNELTGC